MPGADLFSLLLDVTDDSLLVIDRNLQIVYFNKQAEAFYRRYYGSRLENGSAFPPFIPGIDNHLVKKIYADAFGGQSIQMTQAFRDGTGKRYFKLTFKPLIDGRQKVIAVALRSENVTDIRKLEEERNLAIENLDQASKHWQNLFNSSLDIICTLNADGEYIQINQAAYHILGYHPEEMLGRKSIDFIVREDREKTIEIRGKIMAGDKTTNFVNFFRRKDGSLVSIAWSARWDEKDQVLYCIGRDASEKKTAEDALQLSEKRFRALVQSGSDLIGIISMEGVYQYVSPTIKSVLGYDPQQMIGRSAFEFIHEQDVPVILPYLERIQKEHHLRTPEFRFRNSKGQWRWIETVATNMFDEPGVSGIVVNSRDITERKLQDEELTRVLTELRLSEKKLLNIFENFPNGAIIILTKDLRIEYLAGREIQSLGINPTAFLQKESAAFMDKHTAEFFKHQMFEVLQDKTVVFEIRFMNRNYMISAMPQKNEEREIEKILIVSQNITAQKEALHRIHIQSDILENVNNLIIVTDNSYKISYFNNQALHVFNDQIINEYGKNILGIFPPAYRSEIKQMLDSLKGDEVFEVEVQTSSPGEKDTWIDFRFSMMYDQFDETIGILCMGQDISSKKLADYEKEQLIDELNNTVRDLRQFAYITSHNLRSPLSNLIGIMNLIEPTTITDPTTSFLVDKFKESTIQLNDTVHDLMNVLLIKNSVNTKTEDLNLGLIWDEVCVSVSNIIAESGALITADFSQGESVQFNKSYLESILLNLLTNSIKYRSEGGLLHIDLRSFQKDEYLVLEFKDNGLGIDLERHGHKIFGLYQRFHDHPDSKGLGLYLVHSQVKALGGKIELESSVGEGTRFFIYFKYKSRYAE